MCKRHNNILFLLLLVIAGSGVSCKKYAGIPDVSQPAYLRVFNNIPYSLDAFDKNLPQPFLTFLMDPEVDENGIPNKAQIVGDFLSTRQLYSASYPINAGNTFQKINYDYPGNAPVLAAPSMNGFDLSAWAQVPSGKHRIMFVVRPFTDTAFSKLSLRERSTVLIDTTVEFTQGEVYTLEAVARDLEAAVYGLYFRQESFVHEHFDQDKLYLSVYNLTGTPLRSNPSKYARQYYATDTMTLYYTYNVYNDILSAPNSPFYTPIPDYNNVYLTTLSKRFTNTSPFFTLPFLSRDYYFDITGQLRTFASKQTTQITPGSMPYISFNVVNPQGNYLKGNDNLTSCIYSCTDPIFINNYQQGAASSNGVDAAVATANLDQFTVIDGNIKIYPTVNIFELVYDRVYHMQITRYNNGK